MEIVFISSHAFGVTMKSERMWHLKQNRVIANMMEIHALLTPFGAESGNKNRLNEFTFKVQGH
jgi:hypothetical protein